MYVLQFDIYTYTPKKTPPLSRRRRQHGIYLSIPPSLSPFTPPPPFFSYPFLLSFVPLASIHTPPPSTTTESGGVKIASLRIIHRHRGVGELQSCLVYGKKKGVQKIFWEERFIPFFWSRKTKPNAFPPQKKKQKKHHLDFQTCCFFLQGGYKKKKGFPFSVSLSRTANGV